MSIKERLADDLKSALKAGDRRRVECLRMLRAGILQREVELRSARGKDYQLNDDEAIEVISSYGKQRREAIESYRRGGRQDLIAREEAELAIVQHYLPRQLSEQELLAVVREAVAEAGASSPQQMGPVMKRVMARVRGAADGKLVARLVRQELSGDGP